MQLEDSRSLFYRWYFVSGPLGTETHLHDRQGWSHERMWWWPFVVLTPYSSEHYGVASELLAA